MPAPGDNAKVVVVLGRYGRQIGAQVVDENAAQDGVRVLLALARRKVDAHPVGRTSKEKRSGLRPSLEVPIPGAFHLSRQELDHRPQVLTAIHLPRGFRASCRTPGAPESGS